MPRVVLWTGAASIVLHVAGVVLAVVGMRPGTPIVAAAARAAYLATHPIGWSAGWVTWMLCALALLAFVAALRGHGRRSDLALALVAAGAAVDLTCDTLYLTVLPAIAEREGASTLFLALERSLGAAGAVVANGLYSIAVAVLSLEAFPPAARGVRTSGLLTAIAGAGMVGAGLTGDPRHLEWATGPTIGAFVAWTAFAARACRP